MSGRFGLLDGWLDQLESHSDQLDEMVRSLIVKGQVASAVIMRRWDEAITTGLPLIDNKAIDAGIRGSIGLDVAVAYQFLGDTSAAMRTWQQVWQCAEESGDPYLLAGALGRKADLILMQGRPTDALREYSKAEKAYLKLERNRENLVRLYSQMGEAYDIVDRVDLALQAYRRAMDQSLALDWPMLIFQMGQRLILLEMRMENVERAKGIVDVLDQILHRFVDVEPLRSEQVGLFLQSKSSIEHFEGNYGKAAELAEEALAHLQAGGMDANTLGFTWCMLSENRLAMGNYERALQAAQQARVMYEQVGDWEGARQATKLIEKAQQGVSGLASGLEEPKQ